jgi:ABC-2 type transport system ATP-binding protein
MAAPQSQAAEVATAAPSLSLSGLRKAFGDVIAVAGVDLEVTPGECFGLLGPNGAGKTTTMEICEGLTAPDAGSVTLLGRNWKQNASELRQRIGIQLQETQFPEKLTVTETLRLFRSFFHRGISVEEVIRIAQLEEKRSARVGTLSGGQKQRLAMACALVGDPELLFLDEPTTGLDPQARRHLWDLVDDLKRAGRTIILTTHYMDEAERLCDRVAIMDHGRFIALGTPQQLIASVGGDHNVEFAIAPSAPSTPRRSSPSPAFNRIASTRARTSFASPSCIPRSRASSPPLKNKASILPSSAPTPPPSKTSSSLSPGGTCAMSKLQDSSLYQLTSARFRLFLREPEALFWVFIFPILLAVGLGIAFRNRPPDVLPVAATTPQLTQALAAEPGLRATTMDEAAGTHALATGNIQLLAIQTPQGVEYKYDDTNPDARLARLLANRAIQSAAGRHDPLPTRNDLIHEAGARYIDFVVPGLLGMNLMGSAIWGLGFSIVEARQKKLLKRLVASPMPRWQYLASFLLSRLLLLVIEVLAFLGFARLVFGVPFRGSLAQLAFLCVLTSLSFSALGLLIASRARTMEAASGLMNLVMLPMWILSGVFFSASRFPAVLQPFVRALPLTAANDALRANMLQGISLAHLTAPVAILLAWLVVPFAVSLRIFRWR